MYTANINSKNVVVSIGSGDIISDEYGSTDVKNIEVSEEIYNKYNDYGQDYYIYSEGKIIKNPEWDNIQLERARGKYIEKNDSLRDAALFAGVEYQGVLFDSDTDQKVNLLATVNAMSDTDTITWYGMDNKALLCTKADIIAIGNLITELHSFCWQNNAYIKEQINQAETVEEVNAIEISYENSTNITE